MRNVINKIINKFNLTLEQTRFLARKNIVEVIHSISRLEKVNTTFPQTKTIIDGMGVSGVSTHDIQVVLNLKNAWQFILSSDNEFDLAFACKVNNFVAYNESLAWGNYAQEMSALVESAMCQIFLCKLMLKKLSMILKPCQYQIHIVF